MKYVWSIIQCYHAQHDRQFSCNITEMYPWMCNYIQHEIYKQLLIHTFMHFMLRHVDEASAHE